MKDFLFWLSILFCILILCICEQYTGYEHAEKNFIKSCITKNEVVVDGIRFACFQYILEENNNNVQNN